MYYFTQFPVIVCDVTCYIKSDTATYCGNNEICTFILIFSLVIPQVVTAGVLIRHSLICMRSQRSLMKVSIAHCREPDQGEGHTIQGHCLLYYPMVLESQSVYHSVMYR